MATATQPRFPEIQATSIYAGRIRDRTPGISPAGKLTATGDSAVQCLKPPNDRPASPEVCRRFRATLQPAAGKARVFYGRACDPQRSWAVEMTHGVNTKPSTFASQLVSPHPRTRFQQAIADKKEQLYLSHRKAPLGVSHDQSPGFPGGLDPVYFTFGIKTERDGTSGELVNPDKERDEVEMEYDVGRDLYRKTHFNYRVGEKKDRNYKQPTYTPTYKFGIPTPHDNSGRHVRNTLKWLHDTQSEKSSQIVNKRVDDFRERTQPQLGKVHDPIKDTLNVPPNHTFGIMLKPDAYGAGDLIHGRTPGEYLRGNDRERGLLAAVRQHLKKANYHNFHDLKAAFEFYDKLGNGKIDINELREVCYQFSLPVDPELLEQLMDFCDADKDGFINYLEFANFLNWKDKVPSGLPPKTQPAQTQIVADQDLTNKSPQSSESTPRRLKKQIDKAIGAHRTSASIINSVVGGVSTRGYRTYGVPTIRTDLAAPRIKRVSDSTNYGDESNAFGLVNPSTYSSHGVHEKDFLMPRERNELRNIITNIGVRMTIDAFDQIYDRAASIHPRGLVSVEGFRNILDLMQADALLA